ncbi:MAG: glycoside hydrolase family 3 protein [Gemmatimonadaceae bacterium]
MRTPLALFVAAAIAAACAPAPRTATPVPLPPSTNLSPASPLTAAQRRWVDSTFQGLSLRQKIGQMIWIFTFGDYASVDDRPFAEVKEWITQAEPGGVTMSLGSPIETGAKINAMQRLSKIPMIVASDLEPNLGRLEGGVFNHYNIIEGGATVFPSAMAIAATGREDDAHAVGKAIAEEARAVGIQVNFAPDADVNNNPSNPVINTRSFGEDPHRVATLVDRFVRGTQEAGVIATAKHFPGHGDTDVDSHVGLPVVTASSARLDTLELIPFRAAIAAGAGMVMTAHIALPAITGDSSLPATLAPTILEGLLRDSLHFTGTTITDAMSMEGVGKGYDVEQSSVAAVKAGADILLKPTDVLRALNAVQGAVERGEISRARIDSAARRVLELKARTGVVFQPIADLEALREVVGSKAHRELARDIAQRAVTLLRDRAQLVPLAGPKALVVQYMPETELKAGRTFAAALKAANPSAQVEKFGPNVSDEMLTRLTNAAQGADRVVIALYVRRIEGEGRTAVPPRIASWIDSLATTQQVVVVTYGNPYLIRQFPSVGTYMVTYGVNESLEQAAARALLGEAPIRGKAPISLPGFFTKGDGIQR